MWVLTIGDKPVLPYALAVGLVVCVIFAIVSNNKKNRALKATAKRDVTMMPSTNVWDKTYSIEVTSRFDSQFKKEVRTFIEMVTMDTVFTIGDGAQSKDGRMRMNNQADGNLCFYLDGKGVTCSGVQKKPEYAIFQRDANLCQYGGDSPANRTGNLWNLNKGFPVGPDYFLYFLSDNVWLCDKAKPNVALWMLIPK